LRDFADRARHHVGLLAIPIAVFAAFWFGFHVDNPYNSVFPNLYIRNGVLLAIDGQPMVSAAAGIVAAIAVCGFAFTRLRPAHAVWLYPFAALFLAASWLIEQRYALVPMVLWLAFREQRGRAIEWATLALWLVLAVWLFQGMIAMRLFL
jgi:alpha-1,2-glucosyltransferase